MTTRFSDDDELRTALDCDGDDAAWLYAPGTGRLRRIALHNAVRTPLRARGGAFEKVGVFGTSTWETRFAALLEERLCESPVTNTGRMSAFNHFWRTRRLATLTLPDNVQKTTSGTFNKTRNEMRALGDMRAAETAAQKTIEGAYGRTARLHLLRMWTATRDVFAESGVDAAACAAAAALLAQPDFIARIKA